MSEITMSAKFLITSEKCQKFLNGQSAESIFISQNIGNSNSSTITVRFINMFVSETAGKMRKFSGILVKQNFGMSKKQEWVEYRFLLRGVKRGK